MNVIHEVEDDDYFEEPVIFSENFQEISPQSEEKQSINSFVVMAGQCNAPRGDSQSSIQFFFSYDFFHGLQIFN
jgi:hypothetical protein